MYRCLPLALVHSTSSGLCRQSDPMRTATAFGSGQIAAVAVGLAASSASRRRQQQQSRSRSVAAACTVVAGLVAATAIGGLPTADGFFAAAPAASLVGTRARAGRGLGREAAAVTTSTCRGRDEGVLRMTSEVESAGELVRCVMPPGIYISNPKSTAAKPSEWLV